MRGYILLEIKTIYVVVLNTIRNFFFIFDQILKTTIIAIVPLT
jgi:hypothetical protein